MGDRRVLCPGRQWTTLPGGNARCAECGREIKLVGRDMMRGWGRTRLANHVAVPKKSRAKRVIGS